MKGTAKHSKFEILYYISTYILAVIAIFGFIYSLISSSETTKTLDLIQRKILSFTDPIIKFEDYKWLYQDQLNCENPPIGINILYKNRSNVPIKLKVDYEIYYGELKMGKALGTIGQKSEYIVVPGETLGFTSINKEFFRNLKAKKRVFDPPLLKVRLSGRISDIAETRKYSIELTDAIGIDCNEFLKTKSVTNLELKYKLLAE
jgi:hypothetical protein